MLCDNVTAQKEYRKRMVYLLDSHNQTTLILVDRNILLERFLNTKIVNADITYT